jgi:ABC-type lipoprotein export system ATPase subunit
VVVLKDITLQVQPGEFVSVVGPSGYGLVAQGKTLIVVTHDRSLSARTERVLHLLDGRLHHDQNNGEWTR